jgi:hypothetical protein
MPTLFESNQASETRLCHPFGAQSLLTLLSVRSQEAQAQGLPCQDYARVLVNEAGSSVSFCVCDGVGSSYHGGFAARYLATRLVEWFYDLDEIPRQPLDLSARLHQWARAGQDELLQLALPEQTPAMLRGFLENLRDAHGSQTVFFGGRVDYQLSAETSEQVVPGMRALFYWMGNVTAHVFIGDGQHHVVNDAQNDANRWSTKKGAQGVPAAHVVSLGSLQRILIYTDGLSASRDEQTLLKSADTLVHPQDLLPKPAGDDVTVLELRWHVSSPS